MAHKNDNNEKIIWQGMNYEDKKNFIRDIVNAVYIKKIEGTTTTEL